jgi:hypothetical protein
MFWKCAVKITSMPRNYSRRIGLYRLSHETSAKLRVVSYWFILSEKYRINMGQNFSRYIVRINGMGRELKGTRCCYKTVLHFISVYKSYNVLESVLWESLYWLCRSACLATSFAELDTTWFILMSILEGLGVSLEISDTKWTLSA